MIENNSRIIFATIGNLQNSKSFLLSPSFVINLQAKIAADLQPLHSSESMAYLQCDDGELDVDEENQENMKKTIPNETVSMDQMVPTSCWNVYILIVSPH
jgi:hypothetical protein